MELLPKESGNYDGTVETPSEKKHVVFLSMSLSSQLAGINVLQAS